MNLLHGDCLDEMSKLDDNSVDLVITDLPFGLVACEWDNVIPFDLMWKSLNRLIKKDDMIVLFGVEPFSSALRMSNIKQYKYDWIWEKNTGTNFLHAKRMPIRYTENVHVFGDSNKKYTPQKTTGHIPTNSGIGKNTGNVYHGASNVNYIGGDTTRYPKNILKFNSVDNYSRVHPTQKPVALLEYLIKTYSNENEVVLDFTMGSGSTGVACINTNRDFIGIEKEQKYFDIAQERVANAIIEKEQRDFV